MNEIPESSFVLTFLECPACGGLRYRTGHATNRYGETSIVFDCGCGDGELWAIDLVLDGNEDWTTAQTGVGYALAVRTYDSLPDEYVLRRLRVPAPVGIVTWQELVNVFGREAVLVAMSEEEYES